MIDRVSTHPDVPPRRAAVGGGLTACALLVLLSLPARAQEVDSTRTAPADTLKQVPADTLGQALAEGGPQRPAVRFLEAEPGRVVSDTLPARQPAVDAIDVLENVPGAFTYDFGTPGWPHGWSPLGLPPQHVALLLNGLPFDDLFTGAPRHDLLPLEFLEPLRTAPTRYGAPLALYAQTRPFDSPRPFTEFRYRAGAPGLSAIAAVHSQRRRVSLFGTPGVWGVLFGYGGRSAAGEYPGSKLNQERHLYGRLQYERIDWSAELSYLRTKREIGAQGGVVQRGDFTSVYARLDAIVGNPSAVRETYRSDLAAVLRMRLVPGLLAPFTLSAYWTVQHMGYDNPGSDTLYADADRYGFRAQQDLPLGPHRLRLRLEGWLDALDASNALPNDPGLSRRTLHATLTDSVTVLGAEIALEGGLHAVGESTFPGLEASLERPIGPLRLLATGVYGGQPFSWIEQYGFGPSVRPAAQAPEGRTKVARFGFWAGGGAFDLLLFGFAHEATQPLDLYVVSGDTVAARVAAPLRRAGLSFELGWRRSAARGLYAVVQGTITRLLNAGATAEHERVAASLPQTFGRGRLGARLALFRKDLILDAYAQGRFWSTMRSRTLHPPTGLLVLPGADVQAENFSPSGALDLHVEAAVRTAKLFITYENAFSGTTLLPGNLIVPVYPLPARAFRFGVYWPIFD